MPTVFAQSTSPTWCHPVPTPFGILQAVWTTHGLYSCSFSETLSPEQGSQHRGASTMRPEFWQAEVWQRDLEEAFVLYFQTGVFRWNLEHLDWLHVPPFRSEVLRRCFEIPAGETASYGRLATCAGRPGAARAVGTAMSTNRWPILIPCHRVVGANGAMVGYSGMGGLQTKQDLLALEKRCRL